jgi:hypothetical protein
MRIARVLHGSSPVPVLALERDGALYDAGELDRVFGLPSSRRGLRDPRDRSDFHTRAVALACAGLAALDERLRAGDRPGTARLLPGTFVWLPPCDTDRALYVQMAPYDEPLDEPLHRICDARSLVGHESPVAFPPGENRPSYELGVAAVLREDLRNATPAEAGRAVLGYTIVNAWSGRDDEVRQRGWGSPRVPAQLGPVLVTPDELDDVGRLRAQVRVEGTVVTETGTDGGRFSLAESIAWVSRWVDLRGGDVVGAGRVLEGKGETTFGVGVEVLVERLGRLAGRPIGEPTTDS